MNVYVHIFIVLCSRFVSLVVRYFALLLPCVTCNYMPPFVAVASFVFVCKCSQEKTLHSIERSGPVNFFEIDNVSPRFSHNATGISRNFRLLPEFQIFKRNLQNVEKTFL